MAAAAIDAAPLKGLPAAGVGEPACEHAITGVAAGCGIAGESRLPPQVPAAWCACGKETNGTGFVRCVLELAQSLWNA